MWGRHPRPQPHPRLAPFTRNKTAPKIVPPQRNRPFTLQGAQTAPPRTPLPPKRRPPSPPFQRVYTGFPIREKTPARGVLGRSTGKHLPWGKTRTPSFFCLRVLRGVPPLTPPGPLAAPGVQTPCPQVPRAPVLDCVPPPPFPAVCWGWGRIGPSTGKSQGGPPGPSRGRKTPPIHRQNRPRPLERSQGKAPVPRPHHLRGVPTPNFSVGKRPPLGPPPAPRYAPPGVQKIGFFVPPPPGGCPTNSFEVRPPPSPGTPTLIRPPNPIDNVPRTRFGPPLPWGWPIGGKQPRPGESDIVPFFPPGPR